MKSLAKSGRRKVRPTLLNGTVPPPRRRNKDVRPREYLTPKEVERLIAAAKKGRRRYGLRDATMILVTFRHGLRVSELCTLTWDQIDFSHGLIHVRRLKNGIPSEHQLGGEEMRAKIDEDGWCPVSGKLAHQARRDDLSGLRRLMDPRGNVDAVTLKKRALGDHVIYINRNAKMKRLRIVLVPPSCRGALRVQRPINGID